MSADFAEYAGAFAEGGFGDGLPSGGEAGRVPGSMRASAALMRGAEQAFFDGDVLLVGVPRGSAVPGRGGLVGACVVPSVRCCWRYTPDLVNPTRLAEVTGH